MNQRIRKILGAPSLCLVAALALASCGSTSVHVKGAFHGLEGEIDLTINKGRTGEPVAALQGDKTLSGLCASVTFTDANGKETGSSTHTFDSTGGFSVEIPENSRHLTAVIQDCPEEEEASGGHSTESTSSWASGFMQDVSGAGSSRFKAPLSELRVLVMPIGLDFTPGAEHHVLLLEASGAADGKARALAAAILEHGLDARVPSSVKVLEFLTIAPDASGGARIRAATTSDFLSWTLEANFGAWTADLFGSSLRYDSSDWDVVETLVPASALDIGSVPGVTYMNRISTRFRTKADPSMNKTILDLAVQD